MNAARAAKQDVLVMFTAARGCFVNGKLLEGEGLQGAEPKAYKTAVKALPQGVPVGEDLSRRGTRSTTSPSRRTASPKLAARYYEVLRRARCKGCKVMAADVLDSSNVKTYLREFLRRTKGKGRIWGLHNYKDVNRRQSKGVTNVLSDRPGRGLADRDRRHRQLQAAASRTT